MLLGVKKSLKLIRYEDHTTSLQLPLGYLLSKGFIITSSDYLFLIMLFFVFGPLLYGGIYIFNDIVDLKYDQKHPIKKNRVLASGGIKIRSAKIISLCLITSSLTAGFLISTDLFFILIIFLIINILYTFVLKRVPYIEIITNTITHPLRITAGMILAGSIVHLNFLMIHFLALLSATTFKRYREIRNGNSSSRRVLAKYNLQTLNTIQLMFLLMSVMTLFASIGKTDFYLGLISVLVPVIPVFGYYRSTAIKKFVDFCWR